MSKLVTSKRNPHHMLSMAALALLLPLNASVPAPVQPAGAATVQSPGAPDAASGKPALVAPMTGQQVIQVLDQTIDWYRTLGVQQQVATLPSDLLILYDN